MCIVLFFSTCTQGEQTPPPLDQEVELKARLPFQGRILFQSNLDGDNEIYLLSEAGVRKLTDNDWDDLFPVWSPHGEKIAFSSNRRGNYDIYHMRPDGTERRSLTRSEADEKEPAWFPDGKSLVFTREKKKMLRSSITLYKLELNSQRVTRVIPEYGKSHGIAHVSPTGALVTFTGKRTFGWDVAVFDRNLNQVTFLAEGGKSCRGRFSPDGTKLAYVSGEADGKGDIWIMNPDGSDKTRLTLRDDTYDYFPTWSPDGRFIAFNSSRQHGHDDDWQLYIFDLETRTASLLFDSPGSDVFPDWKQ
jgi:Tol biopolymer transport system component